MAFYDNSTPFPILLEELQSMLDLPHGLTIVADTTSDATPANDQRSGATTVYLIEVDNTANVAATYTKFYDAAAPTVGTTAPDLVLKTPAGKRRIFPIPHGLAFSTGLSFASVTAGGTAGTTSPTSATPVRVACS